jgi:hypothetical protein
MSAQIVQFQVRQIADVGSSNPIVARLAFQWIEILRWFELPKGTSNAVFETMHGHVMPRVVECEKISKELTGEIGEIQAEIDRDGINFKSGGRVVEVPTILRLSERAEDYLYKAKLVLRDFSKIFEHIFNITKTTGNYDKISKAIEEKFGRIELSKKIAEDSATWIRQIREMRDAVEHEDATGAPLRINNFSFDFSDPENIVAHEPYWFLRNKPATLISKDMAIFNYNLLTFCEETLLQSLLQLPLKAPIRFVEIPEGERNPSSPIRFRPDLGLPN